jgi:hypothetical protein
MLVSVTLRLRWPRCERDTRSCSRGRRLEVSRGSRAYTSGQPRLTRHAMSYADPTSADRVLKRLLELPAPQRPAFLDTACGGDSKLRALVQRLLAGAGLEPGWREPVGRAERRCIVTSMRPHNVIDL